MTGEKHHYDGWANGQAFCTCGSVFDSVQQFERHAGLTIPTAVPSEVAETTAGEREVEALFDCSCGHSIAEHNGLGCYARLSYTPLVTCECPLTDDRTHGELLAPRLAALLDRVRREEGERIAQAIEALPWARDFEDVGQKCADLARAASVGRGEGL